MNNLRLVNIRSFIDSGSIRIAPLTLLLGQNSSGKSTIARFFPLLRQTAEVLTREPFLWFGRLIDFGSIDEATSKIASEKSVGADFEFQVDQSVISRRRRGLMYYRMPAPTGHATNVKVGLRYGVKEGQRNAFNFSIEFLGHIISLEIQDSNVTQVQINNSDLSSVASGSLVVSTWSSCFPNISFKDTNSVVADANIFARHLRVFVRNHTHGKSGTERVEALTRNLLSAPLDSLLSSVKTASASDSMWQRTTLNWTESSLDFKRVSDLIIGARIAEIIEVASIAFRVICEQTRYITPIRASAERYYRQQGLALGEIDPQGHNVAMFLHNLTQTERQRFSEWMSGFFGFFVDTQTSQGHVSLVIRDADATKGKLSFNLADTGFGFSQMIPILLQIWVTSINRIKNPQPSGLGKIQLISIEQPELHLHPRLQARVADVLLQAIVAARENGIDLRLVIETHSEQIVNRVGKRIAEGTFKAEDTNVVLFEKSELSAPTVVKQTTYDSEGLLNQWPYGFFDSED